MTHAELIAALEAATGPSRELDAELEQAVKGYSTLGLSLPPVSLSPRYTSSIDAALTLVPEGWKPTIYHDGAAVWRHETMDSPLCEEIEVRYEVNGPPAIALCIAALKARQ